MHPTNTNPGPFYNSRMPAADENLVAELAALNETFGSIPPPPPLSRQLAYEQDDRTVLDILYQLERSMRELRAQVDRVMRTVSANNHCVRDIRTSQQKHQQHQADLNAGRASPIAYSPSSPHY